MGEQGEPFRLHGHFTALHPSDSSISHRCQSKTRLDSKLDWTLCLMSLVSHGCSRSSDSRRSAYFDHLSGGGRKRPSVDFASSAYFDHLFREGSCSHVRPGKSQARKRRLGPAKIDWLIQPGTVHQHHERHLSRKKKERTSAVE